MTNPNSADGTQRAGWAATVGTAIALQWSVIGVLAALAWLWKGNAGAVSLLLGGGCVAVPNTLLAAWLTARVRRFGGAGAAALMGGELLKLGMTVALLVAAVRGNPGIVWLALIVGVVGALKAQWLALWMTRNY